MWTLVELIPGSGFLPGEGRGYVSTERDCGAVECGTLVLSKRR